MTAMTAFGRGVLALIVASTLVSSELWAEESLPPVQYKLKEAQPSVGTNIRKDVVLGSSIPLNRRYGDMTAAEKQSIKAQYEDMPEADEPPFPVEGLGKIYDNVRKVVEKLQATGDMTLVVNIDASGEATSVRVLQSNDAELTRTVASILMLTKYKPAVCAGNPCAMDYPFRIAAKLRY